MTATNTELDLLALFSRREVAEKYTGYIKEYTVLDQTKKIIGDMEGYYLSYPEESVIDWTKFSTWFCVLKNSRMDPGTLGVYKLIFDQLAKRDPSAVSEDVLKHFIKLDYAARVRQLAQDAIDGKPGTNLDGDIEAVLSEYRGMGGVHGHATSTGPIVTSDLPTLIGAAGRVGGSEWRLEDLNIGVGPLHRGDFVVIAARPETGKTSFVCSEGVHMVSHDASGANGIIFNNEEAGERIKLRLYQAALGLSLAEIERDPAKAEAEYARIMGTGDRIDVYHSHSITTKDVERQLRKRNYGWIAFNRLDKIKMPKRKVDQQSSDVEQLNQVYQWARGIAIRYGIVFAVVQADASAEGKHVIWMDQVYGSKTGIQGEADVFLTIGKKHDATCNDRRWINVVKNKLPGGPRTDPSLTHALWEIKFERDTGRYTSLIYKSPS